MGLSLYTDDNNYYFMFASNALTLFLKKCERLTGQEFWLFIITSLNVYIIRFLEFFVIIFKKTVYLLQTSTTQACGLRM